MTKKRSSKKRPPMQRKSRPQTEMSPQPMDRRAMEKTMADLGRILSEQKFESIDEANAFIQNLMQSGQPLDRPGETPLEQAQDIMYQAWDAQGVRRIRLARQALTISEDCADAYVLLAEEAANNIEEAKAFYEKGVAAGERALGPERFEEDAGHFWGIIETRPYMRARAGLAGCLYRLGEREQAVAHYQDMLRLNPGDNQGIRYLLANLLLEIGDDKALNTLLEQYEDDASAVWSYTRALMTFQEEGPSKAATARLNEALSYNPFVPAYLLGEKRLPRHLPEYMGLGDENEAIHYAVEAQAIWGQDREALAWLQRTWASFQE
jgi:tetratricopeptide (TPR) repeat protein